MLARHRLLLVLTVLLLAAIAANHAQEVAILTANEDGGQRGDSWAQLEKTVRLPGDSTICLRFNIKVFRLLTAILYLFDTTDSDNDPISFEVYFEKIRTKYGGYGRFYALPDNLATDTWYHYCQVRDVANGLGQAYLDGELIVNEEIAFKPDNIERRLFIGQDEFEPPYSFSGRLTQINVWGSALSPEGVKRLADCQDQQEGDIVKWSDQWTLSNMNYSGSVALSALCAGGSSGSRIVALPRLRFGDAFKTCRGLGGYILVPKDLQQIAGELQVFKGQEECERQWAGLSDAGSEGFWRDPFHDIKYPTATLAFRTNNPDGDRYQNCIRLDPEGLEDTECKKSSCSTCHVPAYSTWTLRGVCEEDERMNYMNLEPSPLGFRGYGEYAVRPLNGVWTWYNSVANLTMASFSPEKGRLNYPIGRNRWKLQSEVCGVSANESLEMTLTSCQPGHFTCTDGNCIPFLSRCDLKFDCDDKTDESFCDIVNFPDDYRPNLPPRPLSNSALPISINVTMDTLNVDTETMLLSVSYNLRMTWFDNRLTYNNLKELTRLNTLADVQVSQLWRPLLGFINTDDIQQTFVDQDAVTTVIRNVTNFMPDLTNSYEVEIYSGAANPVSTTRKYFTIYTCHFDLTLYPFDIQECFMQIQILSASREYLIFNLNGSNVDYLGSKYLVEYGIGKIALTVDNTKQYSEARVTVQLIRRYGYAMLNIYIPSLTLLIISCLTLFFRPSIFEVRVMTALTALLVLATLFTQVSASLPKTSYFKMVDIWLLFCIIVIFFIILFHAIIDSYVDYGQNSTVMSWTGDEKETKKIKEILMTGTDGKQHNKLLLCIFLARALIFTMFSIFNFVYWGTLGVSSGLVYIY